MARKKTTTKKGKKHAKLTNPAKTVKRQVRKRSRARIATRQDAKSRETLSNRQRYDGAKRARRILPDGGGAFGGLSAAIARASRSAPSDREIGKKSKLQHRDKSTSRRLSALTKKERALQKELAELKRQRKLFKQGYSKREIVAQAKKILKEQLDNGKRHAEIMRKALDKSQDSLSQYQPSSHIHVNDDGSVDGELSMTAIDDYERQFSDITLELPRMRGAWLSPEIYYLPEMEDFYDESDFLVRHGLVGVPIHSGLSMPTRSQWEKPSGITKALTARLLAERIEEGSGFTPSQIVVRVYWSPTGERPLSTIDVVKKKKKRAKR